jgi:Family of unknown function (DUF6069)
MTWTRLLAVGAGTVLVTTIVNVLLALALAGSLQVPSGFTPLRPSSVASLTVAGVAGAVVVFALLVRFTPSPVRTFRAVAAVGLVVSWLAPLSVWAFHAFPGTSGPAVLSLMTLHLVAAGLAALLLGQYGLEPARRAA